MEKIISSPLLTAFNNISSLGSTNKSIVKLKRSYKDFSNFLQIKKIELDKLKLPNKKEISQLSNLNIASTFGNPGRLLSSFASGALDAAGFLTNFFPVGGGNRAKPTPSGIKPPKPLVRGSTLKIGGLRSIGVVNALFSGLDFATGLQEGESVGKAAAGAGGSLAGSLLGGAIGQALIPIPGVGFVLGSMAGGFLGGWGADRITEIASGKQGGVSQKLGERLKTQEETQKKAVQEKQFTNVISDFSNSVSKFEDFVYKSFASVVNAAASVVGSEDMLLDYGLDPDAVPSAPELSGELPNMSAEGGELPSKFTSSSYGLRWGRPHTGVDYATTQGTPVSVIQPGQVTYARWNDGGYGYAVQVAHPGGTSSFYGHLSKISVKEGQQIEPGTVIGNVGSTGRSTGPHVHFEIRKGDQKLKIPDNEGDRYFRFGGNIKVKPNVGSASGKPTAVLMAGTNDYGDPKSGAAGITKAIKELQAKGYRVVVVPPSEQGKYSDVSRAVQNAAVSSGATIQKGQYNPNDPTAPYTHLLPESAKSIREKYKGATFIGDSNAELISGAKSYRGQTANYIAGQIRSVIPAAKPQVRGQGGPDLPDWMLPPTTNKSNKIETYPSYNQAQSSITIMPMIVGNQNAGTKQSPVFIPTGGGGQGTVILPGPSEGQVVNSLMKTMLLTNLSAT